jgi:hypothetical protein
MKMDLSKILCEDGRWIELAIFVPCQMEMWNFLLLPKLVREYF